ncbi:MAG: methyltransferase domain-containing protein [Planctomycetes bacterium]|nr:methyltransferase domain-containing protein [Planctomycetota bacterium]
MASEPSPAKTWDFDEYDGLERYDERMRSSKRLCYEETLRRLPELAGAKAGDSVLDIGCGTGNSAVPFLQLGCRVVGMDPSQKMLKLAEDKLRRHTGAFSVQHVDDPFLRIPFDAETFDVVVAAYAIHHLDEPAKQRAVREMKRVLKPGGRIVVADTMFHDAAHKARALAEHRDLEDEYQPLLATFPAMFEAEGFATKLEQVGDLVWVLVAYRSTVHRPLTIPH